jgi:hypothetical protein
MQFNSKEHRRFHICIKCGNSFPVRTDFTDNVKDESKRCVCGEEMFPYEPIVEISNA